MARTRSSNGNYVIHHDTKITRLDAHSTTSAVAAAKTLKLDGELRLYGTHVVILGWLKGGRFTEH